MSGIVFGTESSPSETGGSTFRSAKTTSLEGRSDTEASSAHVFSRVRGSSFTAGTAGCFSDIFQSLLAVSTASSGRLRRVGGRRRKVVRYEPAGFSYGPSNGL